MSDVNVQLVREFFELNSFRVMTLWQHDSGARGAEHGLRLFVENVSPVADREPGLVLRVGDAVGLHRALVEVRAWHADRLYASLIESNPVLFEVAGAEAREHARGLFGADDFKTILVVSELPTSPEAQARSLAAFQNAGIDHLIEFPTVLHEILDRLNPSVSYAPSLTLQTLRLLKRYGLVRRQQLEFPFPTDPPVLTGTAPVETAEESIPDPVEEDLF